MRALIISIVFLSVASGLNGQYQISGTVQNEIGEPLIGASVFLHRTEYATISDENGEFLIDDVEPGFYLVKCTYIGYEAYSEGYNIEDDLELDFIMIRGVYNLDNIEIIADRLTENSPFTYESYKMDEFENKNLGQDLPILLEHTPSLVATSDAGNGIGYTGLRIRGTDPTRTNVTINGVPLNDSESHGVFWVNLPDFASSVNDLQIQRGVGPSTNGPAAFGATLALNTNRVFENPYVELNTGYGSFDTKKASVSMNTGLINNSFMIEGRYSWIKSDGYVDRARSELSSWYFSAAKINANSSIRFNAFSGKEQTYQSWFGVPEAKLDDNADLMAHYQRNVGSIYLNEQDSLNLFDSGRTYNYYTYDNQVDDYKQNHLQLIYTVQAGDNVRLNTTLHHTTGRGFFEEFRYQDDLCQYDLCDSIQFMDIIRRRWLDNRFYGLIANAEIDAGQNATLFVGGSFNRYDGDHFGEVVDTRDSIVPVLPVRYYFNNGLKDDVNVYAKVNYTPGSRLNIFGDIQSRWIDYSAFGEDNGDIPILIDQKYHFINPKAGVSYRLTDSLSIYASYAVAQKEPVRSDFTDAIGTTIPESEKLNDFEAGVRITEKSYGLNINLYYMNYQDQLVNTGAVNDVGAPVRVNVDDSYRLGLELSADIRLSSSLTLLPNLTWSRNKIDRFDEIIVDYATYELQTIPHENTDIAFSPNWIAGNTLLYDHNEQWTFSFFSKYVGQQFLDNTSNPDRQLEAYFVNNLAIEYTLDLDVIQEVKFSLLVNNLTNTRYSANGYTFSYIFGESITENYYYPQAGINFLLNVSARF